MGMDKNEFASYGLKRSIRGMILWLALLVLAVVYRISSPFVDWLPNFAPVMAIAFCGSVYTRSRLAALVPLLALMVSDLVLNVHYGVALLRPAMVASYGCYMAASMLGLFISGRRTWALLAGGTVASSLLFYLVTNSAAWLGNPVYLQTWSGWVQALTIGEPGYAPTFLFFRNSLLGDLVFSGFFAFCMEWSAAHDGRRSLLSARCCMNSNEV